MADNKYKEGNSLSDNYLYTNPYATEGGAMKLKIDKTSNCNYLASVGFVVAAGGATTTITPLTGNLGADLKYYRVELQDGTNNVSVANSLDLANRTTPFVVDTSTLDPKAPWVLSFFGCEGGDIGDAGCSLEYCKSLGIIGVVGGSGDTIPSAANWTNLSYKLLLVTTDDGTYTGFPTEGVDIADGGVININDYGTVAQLVNTGSYVFKLQMKKVGNQPVASTPTPADNDAYSGFTDGVTFPYAVTKDFVDVLATLTIKTDVAGVKSGTMTFAVANEGVKPSISFTITTDVA
jgi:hypothetical protein